MQIQSVSPREAADLLSASRGFVYLDVRSIPEFSQGHPQGAVNIPLLHQNPESLRMEPNPHFLQVVKANFPPATPLLVGCLSGGRSLEAARVLARAGYQNVSNVRCGFGGARNLFGKVVEPGWAALGLPIEVEETAGKSYQALFDRVPA